MTQPLNIIILGGGIAGLTTALSLTKFSPPSHPPPNITIFEIRPEPATLGGAVNLTPNALRLLAHLGVLDEIRAQNHGHECLAVEVFDLYSGAKVAESSFRGADGKGVGDPAFTALRICRGDALKSVISVLERHDNISLICGKKTVEIRETGQGVTICFADGAQASADMLIGCDGIHSATRLLHVEPERTAVYSGICNAFGFAPRRRGENGDFALTHFETSALNFGRRGILLTSFHNATQDSIYVGALMQVPEIASRDGWKAAGADAEKTRGDMLERYGGAANPLIEQCIRDTRDLFLWPVFTLSKGGKWATERVVLIGDSAHAMPPQGESTGIVFEDGVLFSRCVARWMEKGRDAGVPVKEAFDAYERLRRARIDTAFDESQSVVKTVQDAGWLGHKIKMNVVPWYLWWTKGYREQHFVEDVTTCDLGY
ncbi:FAD/NAD(P)-binding domain-containing protein [Dothidotthia symphoricarpi CBS 119687]|uniref:FAD/NAD(P)-binding domain-containing protein n=1 Tax=Dothidotthia symphoricarpi CBS 119687 TaxID=1392245 RepID=A0A6A6APP0_9PLEO|nr:FAD/NAD(P)-binding domain-containing protein [Dothidotthia symphoricarpi CBS 119687]KAF2133962.1 FAD/NAD(P)-binding domain-containing protein [Dothidotthia symphoricarpi CBS 119687]